MGGRTRGKKGRGKGEGFPNRRGEITRISSFRTKKKEKKKKKKKKNRGQKVRNR